MGLYLPVVRMYVGAWDYFMKACTVMFIVFNGHQGGSYRIFVDFSKILILGRLATIFRSKFELEVFTKSEGIYFW